MHILSVSRRDVTVHYGAVFEGLLVPNADACLAVFQKSSTSLAMFFAHVHKLTHLCAL